jgi:hypothetical protein
VWQLGKGKNREPWRLKRITGAEPRGFPVYREYEMKELERLCRWMEIQ